MTAPMARTPKAPDGALHERRVAARGGQSEPEQKEIENRQRRPGDDREQGRDLTPADQNTLRADSIGGHADENPADDGAGAQDRERQRRAPERDPPILHVRHQVDGHHLIESGAASTPSRGATADIGQLRGWWSRPDATDRSVAAPVAAGENA
jgi:hypothetical protein